MVIVTILSILDLLGGSLLVFKISGLFAIIFGIFHTGKGLFSLGMSFSKRYLFDWMGFVDFITGVGFILFSENIYLLSTFGIATIAKGSYCLAISKV